MKMEDTKPLVISKQQVGSMLVKAQDLIEEEEVNVLTYSIYEMLKAIWMRMEAKRENAHYLPSQIVFILKREGLL